MKLLKLSALAAAVLGSTAAMAATDAVVVTDANAVVVESQPAYQYDRNAGLVRNTAGAVTGTTKTLFDTVTNPAAISAEVGTMGYGANIAWGLNETTELQAGWSGMDFDGDQDLDDNDWINWSKAFGDGYGRYDGNIAYDFDFSNPYIGVQMRPFANDFTFAGGVMVPDNKIKATLTSNSTDATVSIDDYEYNIGNDTINIKAENKNTLAPYATIGYRPNINKNWGGFFEVGAAYMGELDAKVSGGENVTGFNDAGQASELNFNEAAKQEIEEDDFWYPIVKAGVTLRF